ncbi:unnamed protein product [Closterium sp. NIES-65]|nr:unnamed protein product [Closterium sp. NIES-65]
MMYLVSPVAIILLLIACRGRRWLTGGGAGERRWLTGGGAGERRWLTGRCGGAVNDGGDATGATTGRAERGKRGGGAVNDGGDAAGAVVALLVLLELTRVHVARYQEDDDVATRREAAVCCAQFNEGSAGEEREERWRGERGALCEEREERWRGERGALARRERSAGEEREERWRGERGALARRERSAGEEREERWRGERGALARRERSAGEEREERWRGERGALARRERSAGEESEERWRGEERWHGEGVLGGECVRKVKVKVTHSPSRTPHHTLPITHSPSRTPHHALTTTHSPSRTPHLSLTSSTCSLCTAALICLHCHMLSLKELLPVPEGQAIWSCPCAPVHRIQWHNHSVGEVSFCFPLPCARHFLVMKTFLLALSSCMARTASSSLLPPVR